MLYINQLEYDKLPYSTDSEHPDSVMATEGTIKTSGCGLCCAVMLADRLTEQSLSLQEAIGLSYAVGANHEPGTDMLRLGPALAEKLRLSMLTSDAAEDLIDCLQRGGAAIINVGGDREGHTGVFSHGGHYILAISYADGRLRILDPSQREGKYDGADVLVMGHSVYATPDVILADTANRSPAFYLFENDLNK